MPTVSASPPITIELKTSENSATAILPIADGKRHISCNHDVIYYIENYGLLKSQPRQLRGRHCRGSVAKVCIGRYPVQVS